MIPFSDAMIPFTDARTAARQFAAVGEATRLTIVYTLVDGPRHVGELADLLGVEIVNMSHHLGVLRGQGLVADEKDGRRVVYKLNPDVFTAAAGGDELGTIQMGVCKLTLRRSESVTADGPKRRKKK